jgi:hypothetical protein
MEAWKKGKTQGYEEMSQRYIEEILK